MINLRSQSGITLVELLVVLIILSLVMAGVFSFFLMGHKTYNLGRRQAQMHHDLRLVSELLTQEMRYAVVLTMLDDWDDLPEQAEISPGERFLYFDEHSGQIIIADSQASRPLTNAIISEASFWLEADMFSFKLGIISGDVAYSMESSVMLLNIENSGTMHSSVPALRYVRP
ncbi:MAG: prepilin-type N-terminal cleavage/methylation domain-containing protein [Firmicutes bacterium]|nr:prepilin-type N-terminal cleavage/methylation domain-containing protein [Bacillota bacterium]